MKPLIKIVALGLTLLVVVGKAEWRGVDATATWALSLGFLALLEAQVLAEASHWRQWQAWLAAFLGPQVLPFYGLLTALFLITDKPQLVPARGPSPPFGVPAHVQSNPGSSLPRPGSTLPSSPTPQPGTPFRPFPPANRLPTNGSTPASTPQTSISRPTPPSNPPSLLKP